MGDPKTILPWSRPLAKQPPPPQQRQQPQPQRQQPQPQRHVCLPHVFSWNTRVRAKALGLLVGVS